MREPGGFRAGLWLRCAAVVGLAALLAGCENGEPKEPPVVERGPVIKMSKEELTGRLQIVAKRTATLKGKCSVTAIDQNQIVPATAEDARRRKEGRPFKAIFNKRTLSGVFAMDRFDPRQPQRVRFAAEAIGFGPVLQLLAVGPRFWVKVKNDDSRLGSYRSILYQGIYDPNVPRSPKQFSMRPQDILDLMVCQELLVSAPFPKAVYLETWPDYYILHVLRVEENWPEALYSKIWLERRNGTLAIHQLFDVTGRMVAEARFTKYINLFTRTEEGKPRVPVPVAHKVRFIWPMDKVIIEVEFARGDLHLNYSIPQGTWRRFRSEDSLIRNLAPGQAPTKRRPDAPEPEPTKAPERRTRPKHNPWR